MKKKTMTHAELDRRLDELATDPETFQHRARELVRELDQKVLDLEITNPLAWRNPLAPAVEGARMSLESQLRRDVDSIRLLSRREEERLARRIEFARYRFEAALAGANLPASVVELAVHASPAALCGGSRIDGTLPPKVCRRWSELHALRTELVERNLYLALINVERYAHSSSNRLDLIQEGSAALFRAVDGFDWRRGLLFRTYAVHWLNQAFRSYLYNFGSTVRVPVYLQKAMKHVAQARSRLRNQNATVEEIAREAGLGTNLVEAALAASRSTTSLDIPLGNSEDGASLSELIGESNGDPYSPQIEDLSLADGIHLALDRLNDRERTVVNLRYGLGQDREHTLAEVADQLGVSLERVRQIQVRAIAKMRTTELRKAVDPFLN